MKATALTASLVLLSGTALAGHHHKKHAPAAVRPPTAMHTTQIHHKDASTPKHDDPEDAAQQVLQQRVRVRGAMQAALKQREREKETAKPCIHEAVTIGRGTDEEKISLTRCDGSALPEAIDHVSVLARPDSIQKPAHGAPLPAGLRRIDARLVERLQLVADHFHAHGHPNAAMHIVSGWRPSSVGSFHATAQALDFRVDGVKNEDLVAFCKTLEDTGCGYYPNSSFVHMDVRAPGTGHVSWIDASGPGESAHYVSAWPALPEPVRSDFAEKLAKILPPLPVDMHPGDVARGILEGGEPQAWLDKPNRVH
jgi:hypothetical protein